LFILIYNIESNSSPVCAEAENLSSLSLRMHLIAWFVASIAVGNAVAAPTKASLQPFVESRGELRLDPAIYTTENFTASDGETYEIVEPPPPFPPSLISSTMSSGNKVQMSDITF
jgi:hypothetical protein